MELGWVKFNDPVSSKASQQGCTPKLFRSSLTRFPLAEFPLLPLLVQSTFGVVPKHAAGLILDQFVNFTFYTTHWCAQVSRCPVDKDYSSSLLLDCHAFAWQDHCRFSPLTQGNLPMIVLTKFYEVTSAYSQNVSVQFQPTPAQNTIRLWALICVRRCWSACSLECSPEYKESGIHSNN